MTHYELHSSFLDLVLSLVDGKDLRSLGSIFVWFDVILLSFLMSQLHFPLVICFEWVKDSLLGWWPSFDLLVMLELWVYLLVGASWSLKCVFDAWKRIFYFPMTYKHHSFNLCSSCWFLRKDSFSRMVSLLVYQVIYIWYVCEVFVTYLVTLEPHLKLTYYTSHNTSWCHVCAFIVWLLIA
jgi:hypothetical protein